MNLLSQTEPQYSVGLGYLELDGLNDQIFYANPFGILKKSITPLNTESALWGIFHLNYRWQKKNIQIHYKWQQIIPFKINKRNATTSSSSSGDNTNSKSSSLLKWPFNGSKHVIEFNYLFD